MGLPSTSMRAYRKRTLRFKHLISLVWLEGMLYDLNDNLSLGIQSPQLAHPVQGVGRLGSKSHTTQ